MSEDLVTLALEYERLRKEADIARAAYIDAEKACDSLRESLVARLGLPPRVPMGRPPRSGSFGLERFIEGFPSDRALRLKDITALFSPLGVSYSSIAQLASRAVRKKFLTRDGGGAYRLTPTAIKNR